MAEQIYGYKENGTKILATTKEEFTDLEEEFTRAQVDLATAEAGVSNLKTRMTSVETKTTNLESSLNTLSTNTTTALNGKQKTITRGTAAPSGGSNGDIYIQYF